MSVCFLLYSTYTTSKQYSRVPAVLACFFFFSLVVFVLWIIVVSCCAVLYYHKYCCSSTWRLFRLVLKSEIAVEAAPAENGLVLFLLARARSAQQRGGHTSVLWAALFLALWCPTSVRPITPRSILLARGRRTLVQQYTHHCRLCAAREIP